MAAEVGSASEGANRQRVLVFEPHLVLHDVLTDCLADGGFGAEFCPSMQTTLSCAEHDPASVVLVECCAHCPHPESGDAPALHELAMHHRLVLIGNYQETLRGADIAPSAVLESSLNLDELLEALRVAARSTAASPGTGVPSAQVTRSGAEVSPG